MQRRDTVRDAAAPRIRKTLMLRPLSALSAKRRNDAPARRLTAAVFTIAAFVSTASAAAAAPPTPEFTATWEHADRLLAQSDLLGAEATIEPLLSQAATLDAEPTRLWFDLSATRILAVTGRYSEAKRFAADALAQQKLAIQQYAVPDDGDLPANFAPLGTAEEFGASNSRCDRGFKLSGGVDGWVGFFGYAGDFGGQSASSLATGQGVKKIVNTYTAAIKTGPLDFSGPPVEGGGTLMPSYFGGVTPYRAYFHQHGSPATSCGLLQVRGSGAPFRKLSYTLHGNTITKTEQPSPYVAAIPATTPIVAKRRIPARGRFAVQVLNAEGKRVTATWTLIGKRKTTRRTTGTVRHKLATIRAPRQRGRYDVKFTVAHDQRVVTFVGSVGVGTSAPKSATTLSPGQGPRG
ncbi:hypothetical protein AB0L40_00600 [Patulibacter sp. NPDC049589]|uniref:hypothetical protein n=1 Tax=Patulibacter sp. NPDC049589 TaxID=3154731 RepID=UPI00343DC2FA